MANTINSTIKGKAYEYACIIALSEILKGVRSFEVVDNESLIIARGRYENDITEKDRKEMLLSAKAGIQTVIDFEPKIIEDGNDKLTISLQPDTVATQYGDIRDVLIIRRDIEWEIGVSVKHNHAALKHSRLSQTIDFGKMWVNKPCSKTYFETIKPIFDNLKTLQTQSKKWNTLPNKDDSVYLPLLNAFMTELRRIHNESNITADLIKYLIGSNGKDYYKLIHNNNHTTTVIPFNLFGTLNTASKKQKPNIVIDGIELPTRIIELAFKDNSKTTVILTMNNGWAISFRIHNASTIIEPGLKFDIQLLSKPENMFYVNKEW
jgi:hypothetical protein